MVSFLHFDHGTLKTMTHLLIISVLLGSCSCYGGLIPEHKCSTKNGVEESCDVITECDSMKKLLENPTPANQKLLRQAFCGLMGSMPKVCCPPPTTVQPTPKIPDNSYGRCALNATPPEPGSGCCGLQSNGGNRIIGGDTIGLDEYPWLTVIEYKKDNISKLLCGGAFISGRYVVTAAHCVTGNILNVGTPVNVRLGEYDVTKSGPDCIETAGGGVDCTEGETIVPIEETIPHPDYRTWSKSQKNDIALIRLDRNVEYTDFIRPICLPSTDFTTTPADSDLYVAGWGAVNETQQSSNVPLAVTVKYVSYKDCQNTFNRIGFRRKLWDRQFCAGGITGKDSCRGDSGGPVIKPNGFLMELVGIVSYGTTPCGLSLPSAYTNVYKYLPWIRSEIVE